MNERVKRAHSTVYKALRAAGYPREVSFVCIVARPDEPVVDVMTCLIDPRNPGEQAVALVECALDGMKKRGDPTFVGFDDDSKPSGRPS